ncbi:flagellar filament capping protein FliD [Sideroxydans lithotrophicus]|uniref:Flagellar hook-associated protein 2 n=1 Tax=Sideroxydans lithotrophicus (strain ES-1) TaxID=580332 RepID=D5CN22_SIDLE|nr:flagellar filament capping protein FliD [Sideroxydans lithotrophicus]ADE10858.1 flagellar hook-associated 2 domain protein [Sideroxydans lithotrophicus ES-1]
MATSSVAASSSLGTIDVPSLVSQLMTVERQPINKLNTTVASYQSRISSLGTIQGLVSSFQSAELSLNTSLQAFSAVSSSTSIAASATSSAVPGAYSLSVSALAQAQNLVAVGQTSTTATINAGTSTTVTFDFGTTTGATFTSNGTGTKSITIDSTNNTLQGIRDAINAANIGVTATIVNDGSATPYRLVLASNSSGASNSLKITTNGAGNGVDSLLAYDPAGTKNLTQTVAAQNASYTLNGIAMTSASNTVTNAIQGVSFTLSSVTASPATLTIAHDTAAVNTAATNFVNAYNAMYTQLKSRSAYGNATATAGSLAGDGTVHMMMSQLQGIFMAPATPAAGGSLTMLAQAGISTQTDGTLKLDSTALNSAMSNNYSDVVNLFTSASGFLTRLDTWATSAVTPGGLISNHITGINTTITGLNNQISQLEHRMTALQAYYTTQYSNLNMLLTSMNSTSAYLTQQFTKTGA